MREDTKVNNTLKNKMQHSVFDILDLQSLQMW